MTAPDYANLDHLDLIPGKITALVRHFESHSPDTQSSTRIIGTVGEQVTGGWSKAALSIEEYRDMADVLES
jgi:hypothetical protein